ncbi:hypothetical protein LCGC14_1501730 [marine sediment metagenome]|uniref:Uncharacterized protein n=1 Tax=marine sediment metagenome TaxID=412755 RepID=A0A0F9JPS5_9ZZZZ
MSELRDRIEDMPFRSIGRFDATPEPYMLHIRERFVDGVVVEEIHRKRVYADRIVNEKDDSVFWFYKEAV